jgi:hypothetical protein
VVGYGYYTAPFSNGVQDVCVEVSRLGLVCGRFGGWGSLGFAISSPSPCGTHNTATEFAGFGSVLGKDWYVSYENFQWDWGLDEKHSFNYGISNPQPLAWNGVLVAYELETFTVDWGRTSFSESAATRAFEFRPPLDTSRPAYPIIGRWQREYGQRLGVFQDGSFYLDWDGDNAWDPAIDKVRPFGIGTYPVAADFRPGGDDEIGTYQDGAWFIDWNGNGTFDGVAGGDWEKTFGVEGSTPIVSRDGWLRDCE